jgi:DNA-binding transcriptional ArsR family regulator
VRARTSWLRRDSRRRIARDHSSGIQTASSGLLAEAPQPAAFASLSRLIGPVRAQMLVHLAEPRSTSQLVALSGYGLGTVGGHLKVLLDAGLAERRRAGRSVLYRRTTLGNRLVVPRTRP